MSKFEEDFMASKEMQPLFEPFYNLLEWHSVDRSPELTQLDRELKIDLFIKDWWNLKHSLQERCGSYKFLHYLTVLVGCHLPNQFGRGELWDSNVQYHITGYPNEASDRLAIMIPCIFPALRQYIAYNVPLKNYQEFDEHDWVRQNQKTGKRFIQIPLSTLLMDSTADHLGVLYPDFKDSIMNGQNSPFLDEEAQEILKRQMRIKKGLLSKFIYDNSSSRSPETADV